MPESARAIADISEGLVLATVDIMAPIERVFSALTSPDELPKWWGSEAMYQTTHCEADFHVGGRWRSTGRGADGGTFSVGGSYLVIQPPHRLDMTWKPDWESFESRVSYNLQPIQGGTRVTVRHTGFGEHAESCGGHAYGWERVLGWLSAYVAPPETGTAFVMRLIPPRPTFPFDASPEEMADMQAHAVYWQVHVDAGKVAAIGPVADGRGAYGIGIVRGLSRADLQALLDQDPVILAGRGFRFEIAPMLSLTVPQ